MKWRCLLRFHPFRFKRLNVPAPVVLASSWRNVDIELGVVIVLCKRVAHVSIEFSDREVQLKLVVSASEVGLDESTCETADETAFVILDDFLVVVLQEFEFKVGQVETAIVVRRKLVCNVQDHFV